MGTKKPYIEAQQGASHEAGAKAWLFDHFVGLVGSFNVFGEHANAIPQLVVSLERPLTLRLAERTCQGDVFLVPSGLSHEFDLDGCHALLVYFDPRHWLARGLLQHQGSAIEPQLLDSLSQGCRDAIEGLWQGPQDAASIEACFHEIFGLCAGAMTPLAPLDPRIDASLHAMMTQIDEQVSVGDLAAMVGLSEGRFRHLFRSELGMPFSRYRLWLRLCEAFGALFDGATITDAAHHAYFSDSAHLARTFRQMFGDSISGRLLREDDSRFVQGTSFRTSYIPHN